MCRTANLRLMIRGDYIIELSYHETFRLYRQFKKGSLTYRRSVSVHDNGNYVFDFGESLYYVSVATATKILNKMRKGEYISVLGLDLELLK